MTQKPNQGFRFEHRIGVQRHDDFGRCTLQAVIQCRPFAAIGLCDDADTVVGSEFCSHDVRGTIGRTIIDDQDIERLSVARLQHRADRAVDDFGFVVRRDQNGDGFRLPAKRAAALFALNVKAGTDRQQDGSQNTEDDARDEHHTDHLPQNAEEFEAPPVHRRRGRVCLIDWRHKRGTRQSNEFVHRDEAIAAARKFVDNSWQGLHGRRADAAGVVEQHDVSLATGYIVNDVFHDLVGQRPHPIVRVDVHSHRHVTERPPTASALASSVVCGSLSPEYGARKMAVRIPRTNSNRRCVALSSRVR